MTHKTPELQEGIIQPQDLDLARREVNRWAGQVLGHQKRKAAEKRISEREIGQWLQAPEQMKLHPAWPGARLQRLHDAILHLAHLERVVYQKLKSQ